MKYFNGIIWASALATGLLLWLAGGQTIDGTAAVELYQSSQAPENFWQRLLAPLSNPPAAAMAMNLLSALSLWLFCRVSLRLGLEKKTVLLLFFLLNFNPEYNDSRLAIEGFQLVLPCHLLALLLFLRARNFPAALLGLTGPLWLVSLASPLVLLSNLLLPALLLFYPLGHWRTRLAWLLLYYLLAALAVYGWPEYQHLLRDLYGLGGEKLNQTREEMSIFFKGNDEGFRLSLSNGLLLALVLVLTNGLHIAGLLIGALMVFSLNRRSTPVLERPQRWFLFGLLLLNCLIGAYLLLYTGHLFSDLVYMPAIMICLWLSSGGLFRLINRSYRDEQRLVIFWLAVAYALASIIVFGPSSVYLKEAGLAVRNRPEPLFSNSRQILYYAGRDPRNADFNIHFLPDGEIGPNALILYSHNRKEPLPDTLELYHVLDKFSNRHGDQVFLLRLKDGQKD